jgi:hypothetical protein
MASSDDAQSASSFSVDGELSFGADGFAMLTLDGKHEYRIDTASGAVVRTTAP